MWKSNFWTISRHCICSMACRFHTVVNGSSQSSSVTSSRRPAATFSGSGSGRPDLTWTNTPRVVATRSFSLASQKSEAKARSSCRRACSAVHVDVSTELCTLYDSSRRRRRAFADKLVAPQFRKAVDVSLVRWWRRRTA